MGALPRHRPLQPGKRQHSPDNPKNLRELPNPHSRSNQQIPSRVYTHGCAQFKADVLSTFHSAPTARSTSLMISGDFRFCWATAIHRTGRQVRGARIGGLAVVFLLCLFSGCSAVYQPYSRTIEHKMEVLSRMPRAEHRPIDPRLLGQTPPPEQLVDDGDILGIYIEGGQGSEGEQVPVRFSNDRLVSPAIGYPIPVRNGGFIRVPQVGVLHVRGMTPWQIEDRIRHILTVEKQTHKPDEAQIHVSLMWKRGVNVMVVRQEEAETTKLIAPSRGNDVDRRSGQVIQLPAFRNDVMNALLESGGFPNDQAENAVYVFKRHDRRMAGQAGLAATASVVPNVPTVPSAPLASPTAFQPPNAVQLAAWSSVADGQPLLPATQQPLRPVPSSGHVDASGHISSPVSLAGHSYPSDSAHKHAVPVQPCPDFSTDSRHPNAIRIPLSVAPGEQPNFSLNDVILEDGDIVLIESRANEYFLTAGLLGGGQYAMPQNQDIDVIDAVLLADTYSRSTQLNNPTRAIGGVSALNRDVTVGASRVVIERKMPGGQTERFQVSLYAAMRNPDKRVLIEPGDRLYLEYTPIEAVMAFFERHLLDPLTSGAPSFLTN